MRSAQGREPVSVLDRIIAILEIVRESHGSTTITQLALATGIPKSTVSRLVGDLVRQRYLTRTEDGVAIGLRLFELGARASTPRRLSVAALPVLAELFNATGEHLNVAVQEGQRHALGDLGARPAAARAVTRRGSGAFGDDRARQGRPGVHGRRVRPARRHDRPRPRTGVTCSSGSSPACAPTSVAIDRCETFPGVIGVASPILSPERLPGRRDLRRGAGDRHGSEPDGAARAARRARAHAPAGAAGGLTDARAAAERRGRRPRPHDRDPRGLRRGRPRSPHLRARAARRPAEVHGLAPRLDARAPALPRARRDADPSRAAAVRARSARRAAARAQGSPRCR